ncbi:MATE family efflux transporter [Muricauda sp. SCSIO 64092]|uniref:lipopolysaccharide biosynthesis protein n=1 Tax=Allomuricauda sp. SCSIO 64092 TaxID=2908842 RepID=UPI001FF6AD7B|nr:MATE family efflux transporter [Muricauda sp. SCSIO 64092]UOY08835.1 MATE family efflux transporter [Muricauda sp. SCSIO 64092]
MKFLGNELDKLQWRSLNFIKQVKVSFLFKFFSILISFLLVRFLLKYLDIADYGLWSVILSFLHWIVFFDLGIANGVKNKLAESLSEENWDDARAYISSGYIALFFFASMVYLVVLAFSGLIDWQRLFNVYDYNNSFLAKLVLIILFFTLSNFVLSLINAVFNAVQRASLAVVNQFLTQLLSLVVVLLLITLSTSNLHLLALGYGLSMFISNLALTIWYFSKNKNLVPRLKYYDKQKLSPIIVLGLRFFLLQVTMMVILTTDRFILLQLTDRSEVARYDVVYRYFNVVMIFHTLINAPLWSMYTEAYQKKDHKWIEKTMKNLLILCGGYLGGLTALILMGDVVIDFWIDNDSLDLLTSNYIFMAVLIFFSIIHSILAYFTNGIGKTNMQLYTSIIGALINIPLSIYFVNELNLGLNGVVLATIISLFLFCALGPFQVIKEIKWLRNESGMATN